MAKPFTIEELEALRRMRDEARGAVIGDMEEVAEPTKAPTARKGLPEGYTPSEQELLKYLQAWDSLTDYVDHEDALSMIFRGGTEFDRNTDLRHVIIKCSVLNDFYVTNIYKIAPVARHILAIPEFDKRLSQGDPALVNEMAMVDGRNNYSFATKYCSHHQPDKYVIYDRYVADVLCALKRMHPGVFSFRSRESLKDYATFMDAINDCIARFSLGNHTYKDVDRYLWQLGKEYYNPYEQHES